MKLLKTIAVIVLFIMVWQLLVVLLEVPVYILPTPLNIFKTFFLRRQLLLTHLFPTLFETTIGLLAGLIIGMGLAVLMTASKFMCRLIRPITVIHQALPMIVLAPLLVIWTGYGVISKVLMVALMCFFPMTIAFYDGLSSLPWEWVTLAHCEKASALKTFLKIRIPAAIPALASGIRIAISVAPMSAVAGEWVGASKGLGYLILNANARLEIELMFAAVLMLVLMSLSLYFSVDYGLKKWLLNYR